MSGHVFFVSLRAMSGVSALVFVVRVVYTGRGVRPT